MIRRFPFADGERECVIFSKEDAAKIADALDCVGESLSNLDIDIAAHQDSTWAKHQQDDYTRMLAAYGVARRQQLRMAALGSALLELVECKDLKDRAKQNVGHEHKEMMTEYLERQPLAWAAARALVAQPK